MALLKAETERFGKLTAFSRPARSPGPGNSPPRPYRDLASEDPIAERSRLEAVETHGADLAFRIHEEACSRDPSSRAAPDRGRS